MRLRNRIRSPRPNAHLDGRPQGSHGLGYVPGPRAFGMAVLIALALTACDDGGEEAPDAGRGDKVDPAVARILERTLRPEAGGSLALARDGELVHCAGFGAADREARIASGCDTAYDIQSITKQFTAATILKGEAAGG